MIGWCITIPPAVHIKQLRDELLGDVYGTPEAVAAEEMSLPTIPPFPSLINAKRVD